MEAQIFIAPGYGNSGPNHWQTLWQKENPEFIRIEQKDWFLPVAEEWIASIEKQVASFKENTIIVAHSLACIALALWSQQTKLSIKGALLIAPPDTESPEFPHEIKGFSQIPNNPLPFKSIVVSSTNDEYCHIHRAESFARNWGSKFINVGAKGHINANSDIYNWPEGRLYLNEIV